MLDVGQLTLKPSTVQVTHHPQSYMHQTISFGCIQTLNPKPKPNAYAHAQFLLSQLRVPTPQTLRAQACPVSSTAALPLAESLSIQPSSCRRLMPLRTASIGQY
jgi:hypothetical protein